MMRDPYTPLLFDEQSDDLNHQYLKDDMITSARNKLFSFHSLNNEIEEVYKTLVLVRAYMNDPRRDEYQFALNGYEICPYTNQIFADENSEYLLKSWLENKPVELYKERKAYFDSVVNQLDSNTIFVLNKTRTITIPEIAESLSLSIEDTVKLINDSDDIASRIAYWDYVESYEKTYLNTFNNLNKK